MDPLDNMKPYLNQFMHYLENNDSQAQQAAIGAVLGFLTVRFARAVSITLIAIAIALETMRRNGHIQVNWGTLRKDAMNSVVRLNDWLVQKNASLSWMTQWGFVTGLLVGAGIS